MTIVAIAIPVLDSNWSLWAKITTASLLGASAIIAVRSIHLKQKRAVEKECVAKWKDAKDIRAKSAQHLADIIGSQSFKYNLTKGGSQPYLTPAESYRSEEVEGVLDLIDEICREEKEGMVDNAVFMSKFFKLFAAYWIAAKQLIQHDRQKDGEKWKYLYPVCKKYETRFGADNMEKFNVLEFLKKEAYKK